MNINYIKGIFKICKIGLSKFLFLFLVAFAYLLLLSSCISSNDRKDIPNSNVNPADLRIKPLEPDEALSTFQVKDGFHIEQVAAEPLVVDPMAMSFDAYGRLYVVEMRYYPVIDTTEKKLGRIRLLEDTTGDGVFDKSTIFADQLRWPTAVFCYDGGIFVAATPNLLYLKDTTGDNVADVRNVAMSGFGTDRNPAFFVQQMPNSFTWGLDNRIYGVTSGSGGKIKSSPSKEGNNSLNLKGDDFSFDPRTLEISKESGGLQHGMSFDNWGRKYINRQGSHIEQVMYDERDEVRNPAAVFPNDHVNISDHEATAKVYRISEREPWRELRTKWTVQGLLVRDKNQNLELQAPGGEREVWGGGTGYMGGVYITSASGITIYRGNAFPKRYRNSSFIGEPAHNLVHHDSLYSDLNNVRMRAARPTDEQKREFLASTDNWFRPVQFANAPDGTLYIADLYREVIDLPSGIPSPIQRHLDLRSGNDRGRIYRIMPDGFEQPAPPALGDYSTRKLVATLEHTNGWHRDTAARLLYERQDPTSISMLDSLFEHSNSLLGRLHALYALEGQEALTRSHILKALTDSSAQIRRHAVRLSERFFEEEKNTTNTQIEAQLLKLSDDHNLEVRYQLAFSLSKIEGSQKIAAIANILQQNIDSKWIHAAVLSSLAKGSGAMFTEIISDHTVRNSVGGNNFLHKLAYMIGMQNEQSTVEKVIPQISALPQDSSAFALTVDLGRGIQRAGSSIENIQTPELENIIQKAVVASQDDNQEEVTRINAIKLIGMTDMKHAVPILFPLLESAKSQAIKLAVVESMSDYQGIKIANKILQEWSAFTPRLRHHGLNFLLARQERIKVLLEAVEAGDIAKTELTSTQIRFLRFHSDSLIQKHSKKLFKVNNNDRQKIVNTYSSALDLQGDPSHGQTIYRAKCSSCHRAGNQGNAIGPDLGTLGSPKAELLVDIIDPNRKVSPSKLLYIVVTNDGKTLQGIVTNETANSLTLRQSTGDKIELLRSNLDKIQISKQSLMPEGLEAELTNQDMADLLEFISSIRDGG